jgi:hypothetical protein
MALEVSRTSVVLDFRLLGYFQRIVHLDFEIADSAFYQPRSDSVGPCSTIVKHV